MKETMAGTEERRRLIVSIAAAVVFYIVLFLFFSLYFHMSYQEVQPYGACAVYLDLMQVSQAPVHSEAVRPGGDGFEVRESASASESPSVPRSEASDSRSDADFSPQISSRPAEEAVVEEDWDESFFSDTQFGSGSVSASGGDDSGTTEEASSPSNRLLDSNDLNRLDTALARSVSEGEEGGSSISEKVTTASSAGKEDSVSVIDLSGLTDNRKLLKMTDPDFSGVDTAGRNGFSFVIGFDLNSDGTLSRVVVTESSGSTLADRRMEQALRQWRFEAVPGGTSVYVRLKYYVHVR